VCGSDGPLTFEATVNGIAIYLDNFAIISLAKGDSALRQRFVDVVHAGAELLFSITNGAEITGPQGASSQAIKEFLDELGPHWYPVEHNVYEVMKREQAGWLPSKCCLAEDLLHAFFNNRTFDYSPGSGKIIDLSGNFFRLGAFVEWLSPQRDYFLSQARQFDENLKKGIANLRAMDKKRPGWLDRAIPPPSFDKQKAATFAQACLMRQLVSDRGYQVKKGDGWDFCHAIMASAFSNFATLDQQWKRRVESFPKPNTVLRLYYEPELNGMVADIEAALAQLKTTRLGRSAGGSI
jgi:hypothetical protein